jgi:hypothetical protein
MNSTATRIAILAGPLVTLAGMVATPWEPEKTTASYLNALAENPTQGQIACLLLVFGYALLGLANFTVLRHAVTAPRTLRGVTAVLCFFGATILPGMVLVDFYDLALATELSREQGVAVADAASSYGLTAIAMVPALLGFALGMVLVCVTAWKAGFAPVWVAPVLLAGIVVSFAGPPVAVAAASVLIVGAYGLIARGATRSVSPAVPAIAVPAAA